MPIPLEHDEEIVLMTLRHSRKGFLLEYGCSFFLLSLAAFSFYQGVALPTFFFYPFLAVGLFGVASTELRRLFGDRYKVMNSKMCIINGVFKVKKRNIYYSPLGFVPDLNIKQSAFQRLLNYGTLYLQVGSAVLEFKNIDKPDKVLRMLEDLIEHSKRSQQNRTAPARPERN